MQTLNLTLKKKFKRKRNADYKKVNRAASFTSTHNGEDFPLTKSLGGYAPGDRNEYVTIAIKA